MSERTITTADGVQLSEGSSAFNHYDMERGHIGPIDEHPQPDTMKGQDSTTPMEGWDNYWFTFVADDGGRTSLDGSRICSIAHAERKGWL